jgi:hypothetical protein
MPRYMFLIYDDEAQMAQATPEDWERMLKEHNDWQAAVTAAGATIEHGDPLEPSHTATTVRIGADGPVVTDGPFAEAKEALGGFYLVQAPDLDLALSLAKTMPVHAVEVRPVIDLPG